MGVPPKRRILPNASHSACQGPAGGFRISAAALSAETAAGIPAYCEVCISTSISSSRRMPRLRAPNRWALSSSWRPSAASCATVTRLRLRVSRPGRDQKPPKQNCVTRSKNSGAIWAPGGPPPPRPARSPHSFAITSRPFVRSSSWLAMRILPPQDTDGADASAAHQVRHPDARVLDLARAGLAAQLAGQLEDLRQAGGPARVAARDQAAVGVEGMPAAQVRLPLLEHLLGLSLPAEAEQLVVLELLGR